MPELTVSMPAYNSSKFVGEAVESVLRQEGIDFELMVVDDGSEDNTIDVVESFKDPRIKLLRNKVNTGISYCHNLVIDNSASPFISHVDSDDLVLPGAFRKIIDMIKSSSDIGQVHCCYLFINEEGKNMKMDMSPVIKPGMDYKRGILICGGVINHLRTYRREVFHAVGKFNETLKYSVDTEMALRIVDKYDIKLVPEFLYCRRIHNSNASDSLRFKELRYWFRRLLFSWRLMKNNKIAFTGNKQYNFNKLMMLGLYRALLLCIIRVTFTTLKKY